MAKIRPTLQTQNQPRSRQDRSKYPEAVSGTWRETIVTECQAVNAVDCVLRSVCDCDTIELQGKEATDKSEAFDAAREFMDEFDAQADQTSNREALEALVDAR